MTRIVDTKRRAMPFVEWPEADQKAWALATTEAHPFDEGGNASHWAERTKQTNIQHYGRWLGWLQFTNRLDTAYTPADRVTEAQIRDYHIHLVSLGVAPRTLLSMLVGLKVTIKAMAPNNSWLWLQNICNRIQRNAPYRTNKRDRLLPTRRIVEASLERMDTIRLDPTLNITGAIAYRDALMLALLAARPLRIKNFTALDLNHHVQRLEQGWRITIPPKEVKNRILLEFHIPERILPYFERYLHLVRPVFPDAETSGQLWLGKKGASFNASTVRQRIIRLGQSLFGVHLNPHLLRDCAATSLADHSSSAARTATALLGHTQTSTTERYYIHADQLDASRKVNAILDRLKNTTERRS